MEYFDKAEPPISPSQPKPKLAAALGGLLGLLAAGGMGMVGGRTPPACRGPWGTGRILEAPLLGEVPRLRALQVATDEPVTPTGSTRPRGSYRLIVVSMEHELAGVGGKSIAVTSVGPGDSKTTTTLQIANAASKNRKILLIDADVRCGTSRTGRLRPGRPGESQAGHEERPVPRGAPPDAKEYIDRLVSTDSGMVLPVASRPDPGHPAGADREVDVRHAVRSIGELFDLVLIDAPALLASSNALAVARQADGVVLVVPHRVALSDLRDVHDRLAFVKTPLLGYVYVRPHDLGIGTPWERVTHPLRRRSSG